MPCKYELTWLKLTAEDIAWLKWLNTLELNEAGMVHFHFFLQSLMERLDSTWHVNQKVKYMTDSLLSILAHPEMKELSVIYLMLSVMYSWVGEGPHSDAARESYDLLSAGKDRKQVILEDFEADVVARWRNSFNNQYCSVSGTIGDINAADIYKGEIPKEEYQS